MLIGGTVGLLRMARRSHGAPFAGPRLTPLLAASQRAVEKRVGGRQGEAEEAQRKQTENVSSATTITVTMLCSLVDPPPF